MELTVKEIRILLRIVYRELNKLGEYGIFDSRYSELDALSRKLTDMANSIHRKERE